MQETLLIRGARIVSPDPSPFDSILVESGRITQIGNWNELRTAPVHATLDARPLTLIPGLVDTHVHVTGSGTRSAPEDRKIEPPEMHLLRAAGNGFRVLQEGLTTIRDCGGRNDAVFLYRDAARRRALPAPRVLTSGSPLTRTGGHGHWWGGEADADDEIRRVIRRQSKLGADCIKVMVDGGLDGGGRARPGLLMFTADQLREIVVEAGDWGLPVVAHCLTVNAIRAATTARVHSIEHAIFYDPSIGVAYDQPLVDEIAENGIWVNPGQTFAYEAIATPSPDERFRRNAELFRIRLEHDAKMLAAGVRLVAGTDAGTYATPFGRFALAPKLFVDPIGMTPSQALAACTSQAAEAIGLGQDVGQLRPGFAADVVGVQGNPLEDIAALERVRLTVQGGRITVDKRSNAFTEPRDEIEPAAEG